MPLANAALLDKLLSHRLRGFSTLEHTPSALDRACASSVPFLEVDTRVSQDGHIYLYHNAKTGRDVSQACVFARSSAAQIDQLRFINDEPLLTLKEALQRFQHRTLPNQILCLDVKDYGFEEKHLQLVRQAGLDDHVYFISWIPQTLLRLHELGVETPLFLSHWNLTAWGGRGRLLTALLRDKMFTLGSYVIQGTNRAATDLGVWRHGYNHTLVCQQLPEPLLAIIASSGGGLCLHRSLYDEALATYCLQHGLKLWLYAVNTPHQYAHDAALPAVDVVFSDDAPGVLEALA